MQLRVIIAINCVCGTAGHSPTRVSLMCRRFDYRTAIYVYTHIRRGDHYRLSPFVDANCICVTLSISFARARGFLVPLLFLWSFCCCAALCERGGGYLYVIGIPRSRCEKEWRIFVRSASCFEYSQLGFIRRSR